MQKIFCICPCCGQKTHVSVEVFKELQDFALLLGTTVKVLDEEEPKKEQA